MPVTLPGWILFAVILVSDGIAGFMAGNLILAGFGRIKPKPPRYLAAAIAVTAVFIASTLLFLWVEPSAPER